MSTSYQPEPRPTQGGDPTGGPPAHDTGVGAAGDASTAGTDPAYRPTSTEAGTTRDRYADPDRPAMDRKTVVAREKEQFGGIKWGSAFFGWLTATGTAVLLTALLAALGTAVGVATNTGVGQAANQATSSTSTAQTVGLAGGIGLLVVLFVSYYCGGYVAGRMARFHGLRQGVAVWVWALIIAIVVAVVGAAAGDQFNILAKLNGFPRIPVNEGDLTRGGLIALLAVAAASLLGAILGGLAGMRFHRKVDKAGLDHDYA